jgi:hypothetical protein
MIMYSNSFYMMKDYYLAAYQFERFEDAYSNSEKAEEALFLSTKSYYNLSPVYSKEQKETKTLIDKLENEIKGVPPYKHSQSWLLSSANTSLVFGVDGQTQWTEAIELSGSEFAQSILA